MSLKDAVSALRSLKAELEASRAAKAELESAYRGVLEVSYNWAQGFWPAVHHPLSAAPLFIEKESHGGTDRGVGRGAIDHYLDAG